MLTAIPKSLWSYDYEVREAGSLVATIDTPWWGENSTLTIDGRVWLLGRGGFVNPMFTLFHGGRTLASATKPSAFFRSFQVAFDDAYYCWEAEGVFKRSFVLREGNRVIGSLWPESVLARTAKVDLPREFPLERQCFLVWLAILIWRREQALA